MAEDMAKALMDSITGYTERAKKQMDASARTIQNQMKNMIQANTPVRQLTWKAGNGIIIKYQAPEKYNPGRMKKSWTVKTYTTKYSTHHFDYIQHVDKNVKMWYNVGVLFI